MQPPGTTTARPTTMPIPMATTVATALAGAVRRLPTLLAPVAVLGVPFAIIGCLLLLAADGGRIDTGGTDPQLIQLEGLSLIRLAAIAIAVLGGVATLQAGTLLAAGQLTRHPLPVRTALREGVRAVPAGTAALIGAAGVIGAVGVVPALFIAQSLSGWLAVILLTALVSVVLPYPFLAVAGVVLERSGPVQALGHAFSATKRRQYSIRIAFALLVGASFGAGALVDLALSPIEAASGLATAGLTITVQVALLLPLWCTVLAALYPNPRDPERGAGAPLSAVTSRLRAAGDTGPPIGGRWVPLLVLALLIPALAMTGLVRTNPFGLPATVDHVAQVATEPGQAALVAPGAPDIRPALAEPEDPALRERVHGGEFMPDDARLEPLLRDLIEQSGVDPTPRNGPFVAMTSDQVLAVIRVPTSRAQGRDDPTTALIGGCELPCDDHTVLVAELDTVEDAASIAIGADGRVVVAGIVDHPDSVLAVSTCTMPGCDDLSTEQFRMGAENSAKRHSRWHTTAMMPQDGGPLVLARQTDHGPTRLYHCRDQRCNDSEMVELPGLAGTDGSPSIVLDGSDLPVLAGVSSGRSPRLRLIACEDAACTSSDTVDLAAPSLDPDGAVDLALDERDRPWIAWTDATETSAGSPTRVIECVEALCGAR